VVALGLGCLAGILLGELLLRLFWPAGNRYYLWPPHLTVTFNPDPAIVPGVSPFARIHANSQGILGSEWSADRAREFRVLTVGGSTTQCIMLDQSKTWPALLERALGTTPAGRKVWVGNLGRAGFNSRDHLGLMRLAIDQFDADLVIVLAGANDTVQRLIQGETYNPHFVDDELRYYEWLIPRFALAPLTAHPSSPLYERAAVFQLAKWLKSLYVNRKQIQMDNEGQWLAEARSYRRSARFIDNLPPLASGLDEYERNVTGMIREARRRSLRLVFLTQPTFWKEVMPEDEARLVWMGFGPRQSGDEPEWPWWKKGDSLMYTSRALTTAMAAYNDRLLETCRTWGVECFDLAARVPRTTEVYFDDMHYTEQGARRVAGEIAGYLKAQAPFK
jgi:lysophospholipase L1-like esterase